MSARGKKTTGATKQTPSGPAVSSSGNRNVRSSSPVMISRVEEKNQLADLNDRLAAYIDRVRHLESENDRLVKIVRSQEDTVSRETTKIKGMYDAELNETRRLLDQLAKEKAKLQLEQGRLKAELVELQQKYHSLEALLADSQKKLMAAESQVNDLQARVTDGNNRKRHLEDELARLKKDHDALIKQHASLQKQLEDETVKRVDLENRIQSLREDLAFKSQVHQQELDESVSRRTVEIEEVDGQLQRDYEGRLADALRQMREENDEAIRSSRAEVELMYQSKLANLQDLTGKGQEALQRAQSELRVATKRIEELTGELVQLKSQSGKYTTRIEMLEQQLRREKDDHQETRATLEAKMRDLEGKLADQLAEYRDLLDVKIQLDVEIAAYRKLLELEETRLNIGSPSNATPSSMKRLSPIIADSSSGGRKRRLVEENYTQSSQYVSTGKNGMEVMEVDSDGKFIKLYNSTDKDVVLVGWTIKHEDAGNEVSFKFPRGAQMKARQSVTVWSSNVASATTGPADHIMKSQSWIIGENLKTSLLDAKGVEVANRKRRIFTSSPGSDDSGTERGESSGSAKSSRFMSFLSIMA